MTRLGSLCLTCVAVYGALVWGPHFGLHITRFLVGYGVLAAACLAAWRLARTRTDWIWIMAGAAAFRGICLVAAPELSDDIYRYIWDGRVTLSGVNPFRYPPLAPELTSLRNDLWFAVNNPELPTIYPPLLQGVFALAAWISPTVLGFKSVFVLFDLGAGLLLLSVLRALGRSRWAVLYLWHPSVVFEFAGQGHADAVGLFFLSLALWAWTKRRSLASGITLCAAALVKFFPLAALPALVPRLRSRWFWLPAVLAAAYLPFGWGGVNPLGSLGTFASDWRANALAFNLFEFLPGPWPRIASLAPAAAVGAWALGRGWDWPRAYSWTVGVFLLFSPVVHPWYVLWLLPAALVLKHPAWVAWAFLATLSYAVLPEFLATGVWRESSWIKGLIYAPVALLALRTALKADDFESPGAS